MKHIVSIESTTEKVTYNRAAIMSLAWAIRRELSCTMSEALRKAWKVVRFLVKKLSGYGWQNVVSHGNVTIWSKYGKCRAYIEAERDNTSKSRRFDSFNNAFIDLAA